MIAILAALVPVFLIIALGWGLKRGGFPGDAFWPLAEKLTYYLLLPALLVHALAGASLGGFRVAPLAAALVVTILVMALIAIGLRKRIGGDGAAFTSVLQGSIRTSAYVGIASAFALHGSAGLTLAVVAIAIWVPTANVVSVAALSRFADGAGSRPERAYLLMARNPLILACVAGAALNVSGIGLPFGVAPVIDLLGRAALPLGLLAVGAALDPAAARDEGRAVGTACVLKLVAMPLLAWAACSAFGVEGLTANVAVLVAALPGAPSSFVLARELGGDAPLMANIITASVILAAITMPAMLWLLA